MFASDERTSETDAAQLAALERELDGYVASGREDRAAEVRSQIAALTGAVEEPSPRPARKSSATRLRGANKETR